VQEVPAYGAVRVQAVRQVRAATYDSQEATVSDVVFRHEPELCEGCQAKRMNQSVLKGTWIGSVFVCEHLGRLGKYIGRPQ